MYTHVKRPDFAIKGPDGSLQTLLCKLCGTVIADTEDRPAGYEVSPGGERYKIVKRTFTRFPNYVEAKIEFADPGYFHVTHGCSSCMTMSLSPAVLAELHRADQEDSPDGYTAREAAQVPVRVMVLKTDGSGIA